jgi:hypothetical protein
MYQNVFDYQRTENDPPAAGTDPTGPSATTVSSSSSSSEKKRRVDGDSNSDVIGPIHRTVWYLNFAHSQLFVAWDSSLFAQDEMQVGLIPKFAGIAHGIT